MDGDDSDRADGNANEVPYEDPGPVDPDPDPTGVREDDGPSGSGRPREPPRSEDRASRTSEVGEGPVAPEREALQNMNRDELLERASELGLNVNPELDREQLIDKLSRQEGAGETASRDDRTAALGG